MTAGEDYVGRWQIERRDAYRKSWFTIYREYETEEAALAEISGGMRDEETRTWQDDEGRTYVDHVIVHKDLGIESPIHHYRISQIRALDGPEVISKRVGYVDVDAGIVQVGDPCYTLRKDYDENSGARYDELIKHLGDPTDPDPRSEPSRCVAPEGYSGAWMPYRRDMQGEPHEGAGVVVSSGFGDGTYPVTVEFYSRFHPDPSMRGRVKSLHVDFISDYDEDEDEE